MLLKAIPLVYRRRRGRSKRAGARPGPAALVLVAASYVEAMWVRLSFDRAIDISAIVVDQISVDDGPLTGSVWVGSPAATLVDPVTVELPLVELDPSSSVETLLSATAASGIVAADDGGTWAGASALPLPFPE